MTKFIRKMKEPMEQVLKDQYPEWQLFGFSSFVAYGREKGHGCPTPDLLGS